MSLKAFLLEKDTPAKCPPLFKIFCMKEKKKNLQHQLSLHLLRNSKAETIHTVELELQSLIYM